LKDQSLFIEKAYVNGEWIGAQSGQTFEVHGKELEALY
jgi:succinate-semialdehyde dehydrogenase/glutarate-semialdehyde dehydrogenase